MVRLLHILLLSSALASGSDEMVRFKTEFSKSEIFSGEQVRCNFVLYTTLPRVEVEAAKFPEFRGFWKDNLILRQGIIEMRYEGFATPPWKKVTIGSYIISPMVGERAPSFEPMKLVFKDLSDPNAAQIVLFSEPDPNFIIKPLPSLPVEVRPSSFTGAVGKFQLIPGVTGVQFRKGEPALVRYILQGEGNFADINELRVQFPEGTQVLNSRSFEEGSGTYSLKSYDWIVTFDKDSSFSLPPIQFTFFDPYLEEYKTIESSPIEAISLPPLATEVPEDPEVTMGEVETSWSSASTPFTQISWIVFNASLLMLLLFGFRARFRRKPIVPSSTIAFRELAESAWKDSSGDFLKKASEITFLFLRKKVRTPHAFPNRINLVSQARQVLGEDIAVKAKRIFSAYDESTYSPQKSTPLSREEIHEDLKDIVSK